MKLHTTLTAAILAALAGSASAQTFVHKAGFFDPDGASAKPFSLLEAAFCAAPTDGTIQIGAGSYREAGVFSDPAILTGAGGLVTVGDLGAQRTTLRVVTYNTHLFGDALLGQETFKDDERALFIAQVTGAEPADVLGLQELWDSDYWDTMRFNSGYASGFYGGAKDDWYDSLNSGLALFARSPLQTPHQEFYDAERDEDALASKGYVRATFVKDGFPITVYNTHTQAGEGEANEDTRFEQMSELAAHMQAWRLTHPDHIVLAMGDFNVPGETAEHFINMRLAMSYAAQRDGGPNFRCSPDSFACTSCAENEMKQYFGGSGSTRLDYILYAPSYDGSVDIVPVAFERKEYQIPAGNGDLCDNGWCIRDLSDHYGLAMQFELHRN